MSNCTDNDQKESKPSSVLIRLEDIKKDPALKEGARGVRKLLVTEIFKSEKKIDGPVWKPSQVQKMKDTEIAVFNHTASEKRHYHKKGTEIYMVLEGEMLIEVEGDNYTLSTGDMLVVNPCVFHEVKHKETEFLCRIICVNCKGVNDKYYS